MLLAAGQSLVVHGSHVATGAEGLAAPVSHECDGGRVARAVRTRGCCA
jgi:hypothetical protein